MLLMLASLKAKGVKVDIFDADYLFKKIKTQPVPEPLVADPFFDKLPLLTPRQMLLKKQRAPKTEEEKL